MKLGIMQPYFFPYIGYFQLIASVDKFIVYDDIKYTKKGWINRNRILQDGEPVWFSLPLKSDSNTLNINQRELAADFKADKMLNKIKGVYHSAPYFQQCMPLIEHAICYKKRNLFDFLHHSILTTCEYLGIEKKIQTSSEINFDRTLKGQAKVLAICEEVGAHTYVNAIGGIELYSKSTFLNRGIDLKFIESQPLLYTQFGEQFVPWLSIIDLMMFNPIKKIQSWIFSSYVLI